MTWTGGALSFSLRPSRRDLCDPVQGAPGRLVWLELSRQTGTGAPRDQRSEPARPRRFYRVQVE